MDELLEKINLFVALNEQGDRESIQIMQCKSYSLRKILEKKAELLDNKIETLLQEIRNDIDYLDETCKNILKEILETRIRDIACKNGIEFGDLAEYTSEQHDYQQIINYIIAKNGNRVLVYTYFDE